jgi:1,4-dihydroxy-2-naphthoate octaprenyltransferase
MEEEIIKYLRKARTMVVSTQGEKLWSTKVFYAMDQGFLFLVEKDSLTLQNLTKTPELSFAIDFNKPDLFIQGSGKVEVLGEPKDHDRERGILLYKIPEDALFVHFQRVLIVRLIPSRIKVTDMRVAPKHYDAEYELKDLYESRKSALFRATRYWSFQQSVSALIIGSLLAFHINFLYLILSIIGLILAHGAFNVISDYYDYKHKIDTGVSLGGSRMLSDKIITPNAQKYLGISLLLLAIVIGSYLIFVRPAIVPFVIIGFIPGILYGIPKIALRAHALGDLAVFVAFGPGIVLGGTVLQGGAVTIPSLLISFAFGFLIVDILHGNNWRDIKTDLQVKVRTVANLLGDKGSEIYYLVLLWLSYPLVIFSMILNHKYYPFIFSILSIPWAYSLTKIAMTKEHSKKWLLDLYTANFTMIFSICIIVPFCILWALNLI